MSFATTYGPSSTARAAMLAPKGFGTPATAPHVSQAARYRDAELGSASPGQLVVMLFDQMLLTLRRARIACEARNIEERGVALVKVGEMVTELRGSLDFAHGGEIATQLDALYGFMLRELLQANRTQDVAKIDVVTRIASDLREGFAQVVARGAAVPPAVRSA